MGITDYTRKHGNCVWWEDIRCGDYGGCLAPTPMFDDQSNEYTRPFLHRDADATLCACWKLASHITSPARGGIRGQEGIMTKHTPGPWTVQGTNIHHLQFDEPLRDSNIVASIPDHNPESVANAALIAAAPDLLAALQEIKHQLDDKSETPGIKWSIRDQHMYDTVEAAIAKTLGSLNYRDYKGMEA